MGSAWTPSENTRNETSSPVRNCSKRILLPASPRIRASRICRMAASASSRLRAMITPLPAANPSALITSGSPKRLLRAASRASSRESVCKQALGGNAMPLHEGLREGLAAFQPRCCSRGSNHAQSQRFKVVHNSQCQGKFGADNRQVNGFLLLQRRPAQLISSIPMGTLTASWAVPPFPGAQ